MKKIFAYTSVILAVFLSHAAPAFPTGPSPAPGLVQNQNQFNLATGLATNTNQSLNLNTAGDTTGSDALNIYAQGDAYLPQSAIGALTLDGGTPSWGTSCSRGTGTLPSSMQAADICGGFAIWPYESGSPNSGYYPGVYLNGVVRGATANNLGMDLDIYTKADAGTLTKNATLDSTGAFSLPNGNATAKSFIPSSTSIPTNGLYLTAANLPGISANGTISALFGNVGSAVNAIQLQPAPTGTFPYILPAGPSSDTNITIGLSSKGTSNVNIYTNSAATQEGKFTHTASAVDWVEMTGGVTGSPGSAVYGVNGSDGTITNRVTSKGAAGVVQLEGHIGSANGNATGPSATTCGTSPSVAGTDVRGKVTTGSTATTACTLSFGTTWAATPTCVVADGTAGLGTMSITSISTSALVVAYTSTTSGNWYYYCMQ